MSGVQRRPTPAQRWRAFPYDPQWEQARSAFGSNAGLLDWLCDQREISETAWVPASEPVDTRTTWRKLYDLPVWAWVIIVILLAMLVAAL